jgi:pimeloyl-ACP methyl ester carboxylesterase
VSSGQLIFISGWASDASCWNSIIETIDRPVCCRHVNWWECLNDTGKRNALLQILEQEKGDVMIVGWSLGALTALEGIAFKPNHVKSLVLVSGTSRMTSKGSYPGVDSRTLNGMSARFRRSPRLILEEFARLCIDDGMGSSPETDTFIDSFVEQALRLGTDHLTAGLAYLQQKDLRCVLPEIDIPVRLIHGDSDRVIPVECARYMQGKLPEARLIEIHGGSHALLYTAPFRVAGFIREAIDANFD